MKRVEKPQGKAKKRTLLENLHQTARKKASTESLNQIAKKTSSESLQQTAKKKMPTDL